MGAITFILLMYLLVKMSMDYGINGFFAGCFLLFLTIKFPKLVIFLCIGLILSFQGMMMYYSHNKEYTQDDVDMSVLINQGQRIQSGIFLQGLEKKSTINNLLDLSKENKGLELEKYKEHSWGEPSAIMKGYSIHGAILSDSLCNKINEKAGLTILPNNTERLPNDKLTGIYGCSSSKQMFYNVGDFYK